MSKLKLNQEVFFIAENLPMKVMAMSDRYAICFREENGNPYFMSLDFDKNIRNKKPYIFKIT